MITKFASRLKPRFIVRSLTFGLGITVCCSPALIVRAQTTSAPAEAQKAAMYPLALFPFSERGGNTKGMGNQVADLLFASLATRPELFLVERAELAKVLEEQEINMSGLVSPEAQTKVGQLTGAKILLTGSIVQADSSLYLVAKIIGTETSRVLGSSVKGRANDELGTLVSELAGEIAKTVAERGGELVAEPASLEDRVAKLKRTLGDAARPKVFIEVSERHIGAPARRGQTTIDPAVATELALMCEQLGFPVVDAKRGDPADADVVIRGEGFSEFAARRGNLISVKARVELQAVSREGRKVIATDRQTVVVVDLSDQVAGKSALQEATAAIAERLLPKLVKKD